MSAANRTTRLFTVRIWRAETGDGQSEWRGKVQALPGGEAYYFRDWPGLSAHLEAMLSAGRDAMENPDEEEA